MCAGVLAIPSQVVVWGARLYSHARGMPIYACVPDADIRRETVPEVPQPIGGKPGRGGRGARGRGGVEGGVWPLGNRVARDNTLVRSCSLWKRTILFGERARVPLAGWVPTPRPAAARSPPLASFPSPLPPSSTLPLTVSARSPSRQPYLSRLPSPAHTNTQSISAGPPRHLPRRGHSLLTLRTPYRAPQLARQLPRHGPGEPDRDTLDLVGVPGARRPRGQVILCVRV